MYCVYVFNDVYKYLEKNINITNMEIDHDTESIQDIFN